MSNSTTLIKIINGIFANKKCTSVKQRFNGDLEITHNQKINEGLVFPSGKVGISDTYGIMCGAEVENWRLSPNDRSISAETTNGNGDVIRFAWAISEPDGSGEIYRQIMDAQMELWQSSVEGVSDDLTR